MDQKDLAEQLRGIKDQAEKAKTEIVGKIKTLDDAIANGGTVSQEVQDALAGLKTSVTSIDDIVPDATPPVEETPV